MLQQKKGFTLIELALAIFVISLIGTGVALFSRSIMRNTTILRTGLASQGQIRKVFQSFTAEVRSAAPAWDGAHVIETASSTVFTFYANIDQDKYTERLRYYVSGKKLMKGMTKYNTVSGRYDTAETVKTVLDSINVASSTRLFSFYDKSYDGTDAYPKIPDPVDVSLVRLVRFDVSFNQYNQYTKNAQVHTVQVSLRNVKDN